MISRPKQIGGKPRLHIPGKPAGTRLRILITHTGRKETLQLACAREFHCLCPPRINRHNRCRWRPQVGRTETLPRISIRPVALSRRDSPQARSGPEILFRASAPRLFHHAHTARSRPRRHIGHAVISTLARRAVTWPFSSRRSASDIRDNEHDPAACAGSPPEPHSRMQIRGRRRRRSRTESGQICSTRPSPRRRL